MFTSIGKTNVGLKRKVNQDYFKIGSVLNSSWAIVCDGLGGEKAGEVASKTATEIIYSHIKKTCRQGMSLEGIKNMLITAFNLANCKVFDMGSENIDYEGMATTAIVSFIADNHLHIAHVGDSRIYLINDNVVQLTKDDSLVQVLVEKGSLSEDEAKNHPKRNYLTKAIGVEKNIDVYYECLQIFKSDIVLMCTDGLYNYMDDDIIINMLKKNQNLSNIADGFIKLALDGGGSDNITVVIMFDDYYNTKAE